MFQLIKPYVTAFVALLGTIRMPFIHSCWSHRSLPHSHFSLTHSLSYTNINSTAPCHSLRLLIALCYCKWRSKCEARRGGCRTGCSWSASSRMHTAWKTRSGSANRSVTHSLTHSLIYSLFFNFLSTALLCKLTHSLTHSRTVFIFLSTALLCTDTHSLTHIISHTCFYLCSFLCQSSLHNWQCLSGAKALNELKLPYTGTAERVSCGIKPCISKCYKHTQCHMSCLKYRVAAN